MVIAVDFDGTIVEHRYPTIGKEIPFAIATLKKLQAERNQLILWTVREGELLEEAVEFCRKRGLEFYAVNANHPDEQSKSNHATACRKVCADMYTDDCNINAARAIAVQVQNAIQQFVRKLCRWQIDFSTNDKYHQRA